MEIDDLVAELNLLPGSRIGHGPAHPSSPDRSLADPIHEFLDAYPALRRDEGYVEFQTRYAGASVENEEKTQIVDILGFSEASTGLLDMDGAVVDDEGFLVFAQCIYHTVADGKLVDMYEYDFAFNVSAGRTWGVYANHSTLRTQPTEFLRHADDFTSWLRELVTMGGRYQPPTDLGPPR
jgi:nucleoid-associated protein YejK